MTDRDLTPHVGSGASPDEATSELWQLTAALRHFGWEPSTSLPGAELWERNRWGRSEATVVPLDPQKGDFWALLERARQSVFEQSGAEAERFFLTLGGLAKAGLDRTSFKKESPLEHGLIPWADGMKLFEVARASLVAAAKASRQPRRYHGNASAFLSKNFLESAVMGQTEVGSFVVNAYSPAHKRFYVTRAEAERSAGYDGSEGTVTGRDVIDQLAGALSATRDALSEYRKTPKIEIFDEVVVDGVSYELVTALSDLTAQASESAVAISFSSSTSAPREVEYDFRANDTSALTTAATHFSLTRPPESVRISGYVTLLDRPKPGRPGTIRIDVTDGADAHKVRVRLEGDDYATALEAHRKNAEFTVSGQLELEHGRNYWLYQAHDFDVTAAPDSELDVDFSTPGSRYQS